MTEPMDDARLLRALRSVGMAAFVTHLDLFESGHSAAITAEMLHLRSGWRLPACRTRVNNARAILNAGRRADALRLIAESATADGARDAARRILQP